jgi:hypothetical protein
VTPQCEKHLNSELREYIAEMAEGIARQSALIVMYCEEGDDTGLTYAMRRMTGYVRAAIATRQDLARRAAEKEAA